MAKTRTDRRPERREQANLRALAYGNLTNREKMDRVAQRVGPAKAVQSNEARKISGGN